MFNINDLKKRKAELKEKAMSFVNAAASAGRDLNETEQAHYNEAIKALQECDSLIARYVEVSGFTTENLEQGAEPFRRNENVQHRFPHLVTPEYKAAYVDMIRHGKINAAALNIGTPSQGGYAVPVEFDTNLVRLLQAKNVMRQLANVIVTASDRKIAVESTIGSADWVAEATNLHNYDSSDDDTLTQVVLSAYKLSRIIKVSVELLEDAFFDILGWQAARFADAFGLAEEAAFVDGAGSTKPTGVTRGASAGVTFHFHSEIGDTELLDLYHSLKRQYRVNASWLMNDATALKIRKMKDTTGQYIWQPGLQAGQPDTLLGRPVYISDFMPASNNAGNKAILFGDFKYYTIADRAPRTVQRLNELYAVSGQVGFLSTERTDGKLTLAESVVYGAMGAGS